MERDYYRVNRWRLVKQYYIIKNILKKISINYQKGIEVFSKRDYSPVLSSDVADEDCINYRTLFIELSWWSSIFLQYGLHEEEYIIHKGRAFPRIRDFGIKENKKIVPQDVVLDYIIVQNTVVPSESEMCKRFVAKNKRVLLSLPTFTIIHGYFLDDIFNILCVFEADNLISSTENLLALLGQSKNIKIVESGTNNNDAEGYCLHLPEKSLWEIIKHEEQENFSCIEQEIRDKLSNKSAQRTPGT